MAKKKIIVQAAITGAIHTPTMTPYLPVGVEGIARNAIDAANAGASMLHIHTRKENGEPSSDVGLTRQILSKIKEASDVIIGITTGGAIGMSVKERLAPIPELKPEIASCNSGSMNFVLSELSKNLDDPKYDWEKPFLEGTYGKVFPNTFEDLEYCINVMNENGTKPEFEVFDVGMINNLAYFLKKGIIKKPMYLQFVLGVLGGIPLTIENVMFLIETAKKQLGDDIMFSMIAGGRRNFRYETLSAICGGNVRVGLEDSIYLNPAGKLAESNAQQVEKIIDILHKLDFEVATPGEAREMLQLKGKNNTNF